MWYAFGVVASVLGVYCLFLFCLNVGCFMSVSVDFLKGYAGRLLERGHFRDWYLGSGVYAGCRGVGRSMLVEWLLSNGNFKRLEVSSYREKGCWGRALEECLGISNLIDPVFGLRCKYGWSGVVLDVGAGELSEVELRDLFNFVREFRWFGLHVFVSELDVVGKGIFRDVSIRQLGWDEGVLCEAVCEFLGLFEVRGSAVESFNRFFSDLGGEFGNRVRKRFRVTGAWDGFLGRLRDCNGNVTLKGVLVFFDGFKRLYGESGLKDGADFDTFMRHGFLDVGDAMSVYLDEFNLGLCAGLSGGSVPCKVEEFGGDLGVLCALGVVRLTGRGEVEMCDVWRGYFGVGRKGGIKKVGGVL